MILLRSICIFGDLCFSVHFTRVKSNVPLMINKTSFEPIGPIPKFIPPSFLYLFTLLLPKCKRVKNSLEIRNSVLNHEPSSFKQPREQHCEQSQSTVVVCMQQCLFSVDKNQTKLQYFLVMNVSFLLDERGISKENEIGSNTSPLHT